MQEHLVTYNQALSLKELGFDKSCLGAYYTGKVMKGNGTWIFDKKLASELTIHDFIKKISDNSALFKPNYVKNSNDSYYVSAPLKSQVFKWFRDEYNIQGYIYPLTVQGYKNGRIFTNYIYTIKDLYNDIIESNPVNEEFENYEEAESACIDKLIEIIKEKKL
jgi:hypothetical protein